MGVQQWEGTTGIAEPQRQHANLRLADDRTDEELIAAHQQGDRLAIRVLIERRQSELLRFLLRFLGDQQAAEDVFQDTFLQVHISAATFDTSRRFKPWLFTIAANKARDWFRKHKRRPMFALSAPVGSDENSQSFEDLLEGESPAPDSRLEREERDRLVQETLDAMPEHYREILLLAYFQQMTYAQIAEQLGIPIGTVKSRLHTAVGRFCRSWTAPEGPQERSGGGAS